VSGPEGNVWGGIDQSLRRTIATARAAKGWTWDDVALALAERGWEVTPGNLMTKFSRMAFRADELVLVLTVLGVTALPIGPD
jgi:hypothetical protein